MKTLQLKLNRQPVRQSRHRGVRPLVECLEPRILLYAALGDQWTYDSRISYSFMPDGTSVGGIPSVMFQTLNARFATSTWQNQIEAAAALWENVTNANLALVADGGQPVGTNGDQQDDPRFGDIRIGMVPLSPGILAETFLPPPANGGTDAGDILFNSNVNWQINSNYDLMTVATHEFGHALGLGESGVSTSVMYGTYNGLKQALTSDDIAGIDSIYGTPQFDQFNNSGHHNSSLFTAANINSYITSSSQIAIPSLDITTPGQAEWFYVNVPSSTTGRMTVTAQSRNLSSLAPSLQLYSSSLSLIGQTSAPDTFGATISLATPVASGQGYYVKVTDAGGPGPIGGYGLLLNFGSQAQSPILPPNTVIGQQPDHGGGTQNDNSPWPNGSGGGSDSTGGCLSTIGTISSWFEQMLASPLSVQSVAAPDRAQTTVLAAASVVPDSTTTIVTVTIGDISMGVVVDSGDSSFTTPLASIAVASGPSPAVIQAIDEALGQLVADED